MGAVQIIHAATVPHIKTDGDRHSRVLVDQTTCHKDRGHPKRSAWRAPTTHKILVYIEPSLALLAAPHALRNVRRPRPTAGEGAPIGGLAGFARVGGGPCVLRESRAPGITPHAVAALRRPVPAVPAAGWSAARARVARRARGSRDRVAGGAQRDGQAWLCPSHPPEITRAAGGWIQ